MTQQAKALNVTNMDQLRERVSDVEVLGDPGKWVCICKASSRAQGWMKSTKVMNLPNGCLVQTTTQQGLTRFEKDHLTSGAPDSVVDALVYVPGTWWNGDAETGGWITQPSR